MLRIDCDGVWIGEHQFVDDGPFRLTFLLPGTLSRSELCRIRLEVSPCHVPGGSDQRRLGIALNRIGLA